jgi:hypothetical protein
VYFELALVAANGEQLRSQPFFIGTPRSQSDRLKFDIRIVLRSYLLERRVDGIIVTGRRAGACPQSTAFPRDRG